MMSGQEIVRQVKKKWEERNKPLLSLLEELSGDVPYPNIEFGPEDGELVLVWIWSQVGMVKLSMEYDEDSEERRTYLRVTTPGEPATRDLEPDAEYVRKEVQKLCMKGAATVFPDHASNVPSLMSFEEFKVRYQEIRDAVAKKEQEKS